MRRSAAPLREREFRLLFASRAISLGGSAIAPVALAFAVLDLTGSKTDLGLILFCREVPLVVFLLVGGIWADRLPRNRVMMGANVVSGFAQATTAWLLITGTADVWHLAALAAVNGGSPHTQSNSTHASAYWSARPPTVAPSICSGAR